MDKQTSVYELCKSEIYRIGWRVQYRARKIRSRECSLYDNPSVGKSFAVSSEEKVWVRQLIDTLPPQGKIIIDKLYFQDLTEAEVARQLNISQQGVNKWKQKMIRELSRTVKS
ncbi:sigma-70 family RNA polymerase sigma factor [Paenibacillus sp. GCM10012306]|uniref:sigma-70 family RNA polymerase sigma factor n=1 Tax=Paenibacillus sp. GCM10012306 TaxID=3317342 RepID=UPI0036240650